MNYTTLGVGIIAGVLVAALALVPMLDEQTTDAQFQKKIRMSKTMGSVVDPIPGHEAHQLAMLLPPQDEIMYAGTLTFTSSAPVEVIVFHEYEQPAGSPANPLQVTIDGKQYALSLMFLGEGETGAKVGSIPFAGNALALHTLDGTEFTASIAIDGWARIVQN